MQSQEDGSLSSHGSLSMHTDLCAGSVHNIHTLWEPYLPAGTTEDSISATLTMPRPAFVV